MRIKRKKNTRNITVVLPPLVFKLPRDGNIGRTFKEFLLSWKAFLNGLAPFTVLYGPFLVQQYVPVLLKRLPPEEAIKRSKKVEEAIMRLSMMGIEHRELRHPENHVGFLGDRVVFIDFDRGRFSNRSRDLNKFRAWINGLKRALYRAEKEGNHR